MAHARLKCAASCVTYMSEQRLLSKSTDQSFGVHLSQPQDVQRTAIWRNNTNIYMNYNTIYILQGFKLHGEVCIVGCSVPLLCKTISDCTLRNAFMFFLCSSHTNRKDWNEKISCSLMWEHKSQLNLIYIVNSHTLFKTRHPQQALKWSMWVCECV